MAPSRTLFSSLTLIGCRMAPLVRPAQLFATTVVPSGSTYGTLLRVNRVLGLPVPSDSHAMNFGLPAVLSPAPSASPWHVASAPASPPRVAEYCWLLTNTVLDVTGAAGVTLSASPAACGSAQPS